MGSRVHRPTVAALEVKNCMADAMNQIGLGSIILVLTAVITLVVLPIANEAIETYSLGPDGISDEVGTPGSTDDDPPSSQVSLLNLFPLTVIAALVIGGVVFLVAGFKQLKSA